LPIVRALAGDSTTTSAPPAGAAIPSGEVEAIRPLDLAAAPVAPFTTFGRLIAVFFAATLIAVFFTATRFVV
jgi:hypothetical protein